MSWSHRLATLESSPSFATIIPIDTSTTNHSSRSSPFGRHLAKYRSLPLLWLRACGSSNHQQKRRTADGDLVKDTIHTSFGHFGEFENKYDLLFTFSFLFISINLFRLQKKMSRAICKTFSFFKRCIHLHVLMCIQNVTIYLFLKVIYF